MLTDPIADMLTRIRNASTARHNQVVMPGSKVKANIAQVLKDEGFIDAFVMTDDKPQPRLVMRLKYTSLGEPIIGNIQRVSKPGSRVYTRATPRFPGCVAAWASTSCPPPRA